MNTEMCKDLYKSLKEIDYQGLFARITLIASRPQDAWTVIKGELVSIQDIYIRHLLVLILAASFLEGIKSMINLGTIAGIGPCFVLMIVDVFVKLVIIYASAMLLEFLGRQSYFQSEASFMDFFKLAAYSSIIGLIGNIASVIPYASYPLMLFAVLYSSYFLYLGVEPMLDISEAQKKVAFSGASIILMSSIALIFYLLVWKVPMVVLFGA